MVTIKPQSTSAGATTYSLTNMHGDVMATVNADGTVTGTHMTGPFGEQLPNQTTPMNATTDTTYGYVGTYRKTSESSLMIAPVQMGARVYIPGLGRFLGVLRSLLYKSKSMTVLYINKVTLNNTYIGQSSALLMTVLYINKVTLNNTYIGQSSALLSALLSVLLSSPHLHRTTPLR